MKLTSMVADTISFPTVKYCVGNSLILRQNNIMLEKMLTIVSSLKALMLKILK